MATVYLFEDVVDELSKRGNVDRQKILNAVDYWLEGELDTLILNLDNEILPPDGLQRFLYKRFDLR